MLRERIPDLAALVEPDRVHRLCYTDREIFDLEIKKIFESNWVYAGHESQVPNPGHYWTFLLGRQPMVMVRDKARKVHVLYNRCPHRGAKLCNQVSGNAGDAIRCSYHGWRFELDGALDSIPHMSGYEGTALKIDDPQFSMAHAPRMESYRGFVFASLAATGPSLVDWLGPAKMGFDDMCDRAPEGEVAVVRTCHRVIQRSNWKLLMENQLDVSHPMVTHESTGRAALGGYMALRAKDPDSIAYEEALAANVGEQRKEEILSVNVHHVLFYPCLSVQSPLQQLRCLRPIAPDRTLSEIWHFRLKGAPEAIYRRSLWYYNLVNSPSTMVNADDLENWQRIQHGLQTEAQDWLSFHRNYGQDEVVGEVIKTREGLSEAPLRNQFKVWVKLMTA